MDMASNNPNPMDSPRFALVLALFGAFGVGLAMMAPTLFWIGALICYATGVLTFTRYWSDINLSIRLKLPSNSIAELTAICIMVGLELTVPTYLVIDRAFKEPNISFQKYALFWIVGENNTYQIGMVSKFFNEEGESYRLKHLQFYDGTQKWLGRGGHAIMKYAVFLDHFDLIVDDEIKANNTKYYARILPFTFEINPLVNVGDTLEIEIIGKWKIYMDKADAIVSPRFYTTYEKYISMDEWNTIVKGKSTIDIDGLNYKTID